MTHMQIKDVKFGKTDRKSYAKYQEILKMPNLLKIQKDSYEWFLTEGLREVFRDVDAISDYTGNLELSFLDYSLDEKPKYTVEECKERDATYAKPIKVRVRLLNKISGEIKDQEKAEKLESTLHDFGINAKLTGIAHGQEQILGLSNALVQGRQIGGFDLKHGSALLPPRWRARRPPA